MLNPAKWTILLKTERQINKELKDLIQCVLHITIWRIVHTISLKRFSQFSLLGFCLSKMSWSILSFLNLFMRKWRFWPVMEFMFAEQELKRIFSQSLSVLLRLWMKPTYLPTRTDSRCGTGQRFSRNHVRFEWGRSQTIFTAVFHDLLSFKCSSEPSWQSGDL